MQDIALKSVQHTTYRLRILGVLHTPIYIYKEQEELSWFT